MAGDMVVEVPKGDAIFMKVSIYYVGIVCFCV